MERKRIEIENVENDVPVEPIKMVKDYAIGKGLDCVNCENCKNSAIDDDNGDENCKQYDAASPAPSSPMPQAPRPGPSSSRSTEAALVATASGSPAASSCLTPGPSSETVTSEVVHSVKRGKHPYPGDQFPEHLPAEEIKALEKRYKGTARGVLH